MGTTLSDFLHRRDQACRLDDIRDAMAHFVAAGHRGKVIVRMGGEETHT